MDLIQQGRGWLQDGEGPDAVLQETAEQLQATTDAQSRAAWMLVSAEAFLAKGLPEEALDKASQALGQFRILGLVACEAEAASVLSDVHLFKQDASSAAAVASSAAELLRSSGDGLGEARLLLKVAEAHLLSMEDPYTAARNAISACLLFRSVSDSQGEILSLEATARAHLLYDPEQALKAAKEALSICDSSGHFKVKPKVVQTLAAAKAQIATAQHANQAMSFSSRGDRGAQYKWPKTAQQMGPAAVDIFAVEEVPRPGTGELAVQTPGEKLPAVSKPPMSFMRKPFKWTVGKHATDEAWYRQELVYIPPSREEVVA